jgi:hypothetical protein
VLLPEPAGPAMTRRTGVFRLGIAGRILGQ